MSQPLDHDQLLVQAPTTTGESLREVAARRPDLWPLILTHPNIYPELSAWILAQSPQLAVAVQTPRKSRRLLWISLGAAAVVVGLVGVLLVFLLQKTSGKDEGSAFAELPQVTSSARIPEEGPALRLTPLSQRETVVAMVAGTQVSRLSDGDTDYVFGVSLSQPTTYPLWTVPLSSNTADCQVSDTILNCGAGSVYDVGSGAAVPVEDVEMGRSPSTESSSGGEQDREEPQVSHQLGNAATEEIPLAVRSGELLNGEGEAITEGLVAEQTWVLPGTKGAASWLVSDGETLLAVERDQVLWQVQLPSGSAEVNGFSLGDAPSWRISGELLIIGATTGIFSYNISDGEVVWEIEAPVTSYEVTATGVMLTTLEAIFVLDFPSSEAQSNDNDEGERLLSLPPAPTAPELPTEGQLGNMEFEVPGVCSAARTQGSMEITHVSYPVLSGEPKVLLALSCGAGDGVEDNIILYDAQMKPLQEVDWTEGLTGSVPSGQVEEIVEETPFLSVQSGVWSAQVDPACSSCDGFVIAWSRFIWDGAQYVLEGLEFEEARAPQSGPSLTQLQALYQSLIDGDVDSVSTYFSGQAATMLHGIRSDPQQAQRSFYANGSELQECLELPAGATSVYFPDSGMSIPFMTASPDTQDGDYICGAKITSNWMSHRPAGEKEYYFWWMLHVGANGDPEVYMLEGAYL